MNLRFLTTLAYAAVLSACSGPGADDGGGDKDNATDNAGDDDDDNTDTTGSTPTGETGITTPGGFLPNHLLVQAYIVFDGATQTLVEATDDSTPIASAIFLIWGDDTWAAAGFDFSLTDDFCITTLPLTNSSFATWGPPGTFYAVDYDGGTGAVGGTCDDATHPMSGLFGTTSDYKDVIVNYYGPWGAGLGPPTTLFDGQPTGDLAVGGLVNNNQFLVPSGGDVPADVDGLNHYAAIPVALDPDTFEVQYDGTDQVLIPPNQVFDGTSLATAWYQIFDGYSWTFTPG